MFDSGVDLGHARVLHATELALKCELETGEERWIPRCVIHDDSEVFDHQHEGKLVVKTWFAKQEQLE